jgi:hypothetical protein
MLPLTNIQIPSELQGFEVLSVFRPTDDVINSVIVARKKFQGQLSLNQWPGST